MHRRGVCAVGLLLTACTAAPPTPSSAPPTSSTTATAPTIGPSTASASPTPSASATPTPGTPPTSWQLAAPGIDVRDVNATVAGRSTQATVVRMDPRQVRLRVAYTPGQAQFIDRWADANPKALVTFNGGYFDPDAKVIGVLVADGQAYGASLQGYGGMLTADASGLIDVRSLRTKPYAAGEKLTAALQCYPVLVMPGGVSSTLANDNGARARRTVVAIDRSGRFLVIAITDPLTLTESSAWLLASGLQIDRALNLDGGPSTGVLVRTPSMNRTVPALSPLPFVVYVEAR